MANEEGISVSLHSPPTGESTIHEAIDLPPTVAPVPVRRLFWHGNQGEALLGVLRRPLREPLAILPGRNGEVPFERSAHAFLVTEAATSRYALDALLGFLEQTPCGLDPE